MKTTLYIKPRTVWRLVKIVAWFVAFSVLSAHRGSGAAWFIGVTAAYFLVRVWARHRPPVAPEPEPVEVSREEAMRAMWALHLLRMREEADAAPEAPEQIQAKREP